MDVEEPRISDRPERLNADAPQLFPRRLENRLKHALNRYLLPGASMNPYEDE